MSWDKEYARKKYIEAITILAHQVGCGVIIPWEEANPVVCEYDRVTLAEKVDAILKHLGIEVVPGPHSIVRKVEEKDK